MCPPGDSDKGTPVGSPDPQTELLDKRLNKLLDDRGVSGGGFGGGGGLDGRVAKLEAHVGHIQTDVTEIKTLLGNLGGALQHLPTKQDLTTNTLTMVVIGLTILVLGIGGIIGGLAWIGDREKPPEAAAPAPMIFQLPQQQAATPLQPIQPVPAPAPKAKAP
jgi:hypothetical protein